MLHTAPHASSPTAQAGSASSSSSPFNGRKTVARHGASLVVGAGLALMAWAASMGSAQAQVASDASHAPSVYVQGNWAEHSTDAVTIGVTLPWNSWRSELLGGELRGHWDINLSRWSFNGVAGYSHINVLGVTPTLRLRPDQGRSAWFWEAGVGATLADDRYRTTEKEFSTRFNFASHVGLGVNFGAQRQHELSVRVQHVSNAGIKHPNPGENFVQLRYGMHF